MIIIYIYLSKKIFDLPKRNLKGLEDLMNVKDFIDLEKLQKIQDDFSTSTGLAAVIVDTKDINITKESGYTDFCKKYSGELKGENDIELLHFSVDISIGTEKVCTIKGGHAIASLPDDERLKSIAKKLDINEASFIHDIKKLPVRSKTEIDAAASLIELSVTNFVNIEQTRNSNDSKVNQLSEEITYARDTIQKINTYTHSLKSIANKQKMLSLNASIEAARSGEAGVGFTVVAKSMGELSSQSATIYGDIEKSVTEVTGTIESLASIFEN